MTGKYRHGIDSKGRLAIPARLRDELGAAFYVTIGLEHSLMILTEAGFTSIVEKMRSLPMAARPFQRILFAGAVECEPDKQGRILLPQELRNYAHLTENAVILGFGDKAEIWDADTYDKMEQNFLEAGSMDAVLSSLEL